MAISIRSETTGTGNGNASDQISITKPSSVADGDYLVVILGAGDDAPSVAAPADWTTGDWLGNATGNDKQIGIFYKKITNAAGEPSSYTFTLGNADNGAWWIGSLSGVDPTTPQDETMSGNAVSLSNDTTPAAPSINTATNGAFVLAGWATNFWNDATMPGGDWANRANNLANTTVGFSVVSKTQATAGATNAVEITSATSGMETVCGQWAFRPYVATPINISLATASLSAGGQALTIVKGAVSIALATALVTATGITATITLANPITILLQTASITANGITLIPLLFQTIRPFSDTSLGSWTDENGNAVNIYQSIDEAVPNDADYVQSPSLPAANTYKFKLANASDPTIHTHHTVKFRAKKPYATGTTTLTVRLVEGVTTRATWVETITTSWQDFEKTLTELQAESITDYTNLYIELEAA